MDLICLLPIQRSFLPPAEEFFFFGAYLSTAFSGASDFVLIGYPRGKTAACFGSDRNLMGTLRHGGTHPRCLAERYRHILLFQRGAGAHEQDLFFLITYQTLYRSHLVADSKQRSYEIRSSYEMGPSCSNRLC